MLLALKEEGARNATAAMCVWVLLGAMCVWVLLGAMCVGREQVLLALQEEGEHNATVATWAEQVGYHLTAASPPPHHARSR